MTDLELEQMEQLMARELVQKAEQIQRESIDIVPRTLFASGVVFLSIVVPLYFTQGMMNKDVRMCFLISVVLMLVSLLSCGVLLFRTNRIAQKIIDHMRPIALHRSLWSECEVPSFRWWEVCVFVLMGVAFCLALAALLAAMFLK